MKILNQYFLTYCSNIHPGESWQEVFDSLSTFTLPLKQRISPQNPFGIGLRLSDQASRDLIQPKELDTFRSWLDEHQMYVFTMNGFPFGGFHRQRVKDNVHTPDWTTTARRDYTLRLFEILLAVLPKGLEGGISTSPLSYKHWHTQQQSIENVIRQSVIHLAEIVAHLHAIRESTGVFLHLDIEPEPDGILENTQEVITFYQDHLIPIAGEWLQQQKGFSQAQAEAAIRDHIQLCYDICHFAVAYEDPAFVFEKMNSAGIKIGKIQISAALKAKLPENVGDRKPIEEAFQVFNESTYLHQVIARNDQHQLIQYPDLPEALPHINQPDVVEWRSHFHVPLFVQQYHHLYSTQDDIVKVMEILKKEVISTHLEIETYTWEVLPNELRVDLVTSIEREMQWVINQMRG